MGGAGTSATNTGSIQAAEAELRANGGNVYALAGNTGGIIEATGVSTNDGKFQVRVGGSGTSATNTGSIQAAEAELRANGGNVYALAGNTGGVIEATGVGPDLLATYAGFNFTTIWTINPGTSRPYLRNVSPQTPPQ